MQERPPIIIASVYDDPVQGRIIACEEKTWTETFKWKAMLITSDSILLRSDRPGGIEAFLKDIHRSSVFAPKLVIPLGALVGLRLEHGVLTFQHLDPKGRQKRTRVKPDRASVAQEVIVLLAEERTWQLRETPARPWRLLVGRSVALLLTALSTWVLLNDAERIAQGLPPDISGRRKGAQLLFWKLAEFLGRTNIWIVGTTVALFIVLLTLWQWRKRGKALVWP